MKLEQRAPAELGIDLRALGPFARAVGPLAIVDLETTGLPNDPASEILEIGALLIDPAALVVTTLETLVQPRGPIPLAVRRITGLGPGDVAGAPEIDEVAPAVAVALAGPDPLNQAPAATPRPRLAPSRGFARWLCCCAACSTSTMPIRR